MLLGFPFSARQSGNSLKAVNGGNLRNHLVYTPALVDHFPSLSDVQCLKNLSFHVFFFCFVAVVIASNKKINLHPLTLS